MNRSDSTRNCVALACSFIGITVLTASAQAAAIVGWDTSGITPAAYPTGYSLSYVDSTYTDPNLVSSIPLTGAAGWVNPGYVLGNTVGFQQANQVTSFAAAQATNGYYSFTLTPTNGDQVEIDSLVINYYIQQFEDTTNFALYSSADGYTTQLGTTDVAIVPYGSFLNTVGTISLATPIISTSPITFHLYEWVDTTHGSNQYTSFGFGALNTYTSGNALEIDGSVTATPEPAALSLIGLGAIGLLARRRRA